MEYQINDYVFRPFLFNLGHHEVNTVTKEELYKAYNVTYHSKTSPWNSSVLESTAIIHNIVFFLCSSLVTVLT